MFSAYTNVLRITLLISLSRPEIALTEDQVDMLSKHIPEFRVADQHRRSEIIEERVTWIEERQQSNAPFNRKKVQTVSALSIEFIFSHFYLACAPVYA